MKSCCIFFKMITSEGFCKIQNFASSIIEGRNTFMCQLKVDNQRPCLLNKGDVWKEENITWSLLSSRLVAEISLIFLVDMIIPLF